MKIDYTLYPVRFLRNITYNSWVQKLCLLAVRNYVLVIPTRDYVLILKERNSINLLLKSNISFSLLGHKRPPTNKNLINILQKSLYYSFCNFLNSLLRKECLIFNLYRIFYNPITKGRLLWNLILKQSCK